MSVKSEVTQEKKESSAFDLAVVLLQAVAWATDKTDGDRASGALRDLSITDLPAARLPASTEDAVAKIFAQLPARHYRWDTKRGAVLTYGTRADADEACRKTFLLARERPGTEGARGRSCDEQHRAEHHDDGDRGAEVRLEQD